MSRAKPKQSQLHATFHTRLGANGKPRRNRDGSLSILALVRVPKFKPVSRTFKTQHEAEAWAIPRAQELIAQRKQGSVRPTLSTLTVGQLINQYLDDPRAEALRSYEDYADRAHWWRTHYGEVKVLDFGVDVLFEARRKLMSSGRRGIRTAGTVNRHLSVMRLVWNWGRTAKWIPQDRGWPTKLHLQEPAWRTRFLSPTELSTLLKTADTDAVMRAAILASVATGVRQGELLRLKWADIDFANGWITILETKTATPRRVHLTAQAVSALEGLKAAKVSSLVHVFLDRDGTALTQSKLEMYWRRIRAAAGLKDFRWHDLRHTCASILAQNGATLLEIGSVLGHKSPSMTMRYAHLVQGAPVKGHAELDALLRGSP
jgi:integrase